MTRQNAAWNHLWKPCRRMCPDETHWGLPTAHQNTISTIWPKLTNNLHTFFCIDLLFIFWSVSSWVICNPWFARTLLAHDDDDLTRSCDFEICCVLFIRCFDDTYWYLVLIWYLLVILFAVHLRSFKTSDFRTKFPIYIFEGVSIIRGPLADD